jgi:NitT/TauT family transport system substrate-binding protein
MKNMKSFGAVTVLAIGSLIFGFAGLSFGDSGQSASRDDYVMKLGLSGGLCEAATQIAIINGYFEEEGVNYKIINFTGTAEVPVLLASGQIDANQMMLASLGVLLNSGFDARVASGIHKGCLVIAVPVGSDIRSVEDLRGKTIGVPGLGSTPMVISKRVLTRAGIDASDETGEVEFLAFGPGDLAVAMQNGSVDAIAIVEPGASVLVERGDARIIFDLGVDSKYRDEYCCVMVLNTQFAEGHPDVAARYVRALQKACEFIAQNPELTARLQKEHNMCNLGNLEINSRLLKSYNYKGSVSGGREAFRANLTDLQTLGLLEEQYDVNRIVENIYIELPGVKDSIDIDMKQDVKQDVKQ